jgi:hypothetical protein
MLLVGYSGDFGRSPFWQLSGKTVRLTVRGRYTGFILVSVAVNVAVES